MCEVSDPITSSPSFVCVRIAHWLPKVPLGTKSAASMPSSFAAIASSRLTVGSSPHTSSPSSALRIASRIASVGRVIVSLRNSSILIAPS